MRLTPKGPPGRMNRKALAFEGEICRLHLEGYSCEAIRQALVDAGVTVSLSTVKREITRLAKRGSVRQTQRAVQNLVTEPQVAHTPTAQPAPAFASDPRSGKEVAESFVKGRITNSLLRVRRDHESSRH